MAKRVPRKLADKINRARQRAEDRLAVGMASDVVGVFTRQGKRAGRFIDPNRIVTTADVKLLNRVMLRFEAAQWEFTSGAVGPLVGLEAEELTAKAKVKLLRRAKNINDVTRTRVRGIIKRGVTSRLTDRQIGKEIGKALDSPARGRVIARTELALADQEAATDRYREAGVKAVEVFDGFQCGWVTHEDGDKADGTMRTIRQAEARPLSHPSCRRVFMPVTDVTVPDTSAELAEWQREQQAEWEREGLI